MDLKGNRFSQWWPRWHQRPILTLVFLAALFHFVSAQAAETISAQPSFLNPNDYPEDALQRQLAQLVDRDGNLRFFTDLTTGMEFVLVSGGCYQMGDTFGDGYDNEKPVHEVCVDDFYMGKYEVTQREYEMVTGNNPSYFQKGPRYPVEQVSWQDAQGFINKLNSRSGKGYRLPTEAEWEYAARSGGKKEKYAGGNDVDAVAWYTGNSGGGTRPVGGKSPNGLGLHDMSGNVWEWCQDWYGSDYYSKSPNINPTGPSSGSFRVVRGGSWNYSPGNVRAADRSRREPGVRNFNLGFRLVLPVQ